MDLLQSYFPESIELTEADEGKEDDEFYDFFLLPPQDREHYKSAWKGQPSWAELSMNEPVKRTPTSKKVNYVPG